MGPATPSPALLARARSRRAATLRSRVDAVTAMVVGQLRHHRVDHVLLKGPAVVDWLYAEESDRIYGDIDLLVGPAELEAAGRALRELGFACGYDDRELSAVPHAQSWVRPGTPEVDLHWRLPGVECSPEYAWERLRDGEWMRVAGSESKVLAVAARTLHVATHAAQHQDPSPRASADLERALAVLGADNWAAALELALELDAVGAFAAGLRTTPAGRELADRLSLPHHGAIEWYLRSGAPYGSYALSQVLEAGSPARKVRTLLRWALPPAGYMRALSPAARRGRRGLAAAYARRLVKGARHARGAARAVARVRAERPSAR